MKKLKYTIMAAALTALLPLGAQAASVDDLQKQLDAQQRTMLQLQNKIAQLNADIAVLRGDVVTLRYELQQAGSGGQLSTAAGTAPAAASAAPAPAGSATPVQPVQQTAAAPAVQSSAPAAQPAAAAADASAGLKPADAQAKAAYDAAYAKVTSNDFAGAAAAFQSYVSTYPDNTLTPNAWYWLGQVQYRQNNFEAARVSFLNVARFTSSAKRPDALYKLGLISRQKGEEDKAQRYFNLVISTYPADTSASMARNELQKVK